MSAVLAVKVFDKKSHKELRRTFREESEVMKQITANPHCVQMLDEFEGPRYCHIVMQRCTTTVPAALLNDVKRNCVVTEQNLAHVFKCMISGVQHLHECGVVHRDIKPSNLLLAHGDSLVQSPVVKVCDFHLAAKLPADGRLTQICGTAPYMAPEMLFEGSYHTEVDLWACGVTAYLMLLGEFPYEFALSDFKPKVSESCGRLVKPWTFAQSPSPPSLGRVRLFCQIRPTFKARSGFAQPSIAAIKLLSSLLVHDPLLRSGCPAALSSDYIQSATKPASASRPSFGPTICAALDATKLEPVPETRVLHGKPIGDDFSTDESTSCGSSEEEVTLSPSWVSL